MPDFSAHYEHLKNLHGATHTQKPISTATTCHRRRTTPKSTPVQQQPQSDAMSGAQQYNFPPPPPPPGPSPNQQPQQHQYGFPQPPQYQQPQRGGFAPRGGRGGSQGGRGDLHATPYGHPQNGYNGPSQNQGPQNHQQGPQSGYNGPPQQSSSYVHVSIGPQAPPAQHQGGYGGPQWQQQQNDQHAQHHGPSQHGPQQPQHHGPQHPQQHHPQQPHMQQHAPVPAPLSAQNYHPNFAPQTYNQPPQYGPQQTPQFQNPQQPPYGHSVPHNQQAPQQWSAPPQHTPPQFNNRGRGNAGRGGFSGRGGPEPPLMGPPIRMGFDNDRGNHVPQASNGFPLPFQTHQSSPVPFNQPYQSYPPQNFSGQRPPLDPNPFNSGPQRGRGGHMNNHNRGGGGRNRGEFSFRGRDHRHSSNGHGHRASSENFHKSHSSEPNGKKKKKRRTTNTLGLTPNGADHEESEEENDEVDEEARLVTLLGPDTPQLPADLEAWLAERRARFPTKARREAAAEELRQRREQGRNSGGKQIKQERDTHVKKEEVHIKKEEGETKLERQQRKEQRKAEKLRQLKLEVERLERSQPGAKRKRENGDEGDDDRGQASDDDSDSSSGDSSGSAPENMSSRNGGPMRVPPPPKAQLQRHCKYFSTGGTCGKKGKCRFVHDVEVRNQAIRDKEANGGKMTLAQRLILNDTAKDDLTILKSIKYLKEKGLMPDQTASAKSGDDHGLEYNGEENGYTENLNYGDN
ncbi:hypothetical protein HYFRA_00000866 [Hymenoscyphus fraxineus]|uniref:C3H1-type domain-containing protein n=1 Tax=Hymenoscyphus fraxineus TaxID=746836 RepID=A0A9N9KSE3_9HELO|nr:hypothetical protein HYFRA_00000866 [Hymenoscyphus fraxineus]